MKPCSLLIRADASVSIGTGHVMRCLALAQAWKGSAGDVAFAMAQTTAAIADRLRFDEMKVDDFRQVPGSIEDALATIELARSCGAKWIVVDGYQFDAEYQQSLKEAGLKVLFVDDTGHAAHYPADLVLNQNAHANVETYRSRSSDTRLLLGPRYALLRREFASRRDFRREIPAIGRRVLVAMGGSDPDNLTLRAIEALALIEVPEMEIVVVAGGSNPHLEALRAATAERGATVRLLSNVDNMAELMTWADVAVSAAGTICWEMCLLGLPSLLIDIAANQTAVAEELHRLGVAIHVGNAANAMPKAIAASLQALMLSKDRRAAISGKAAELVDGRGAERVVAAMRGHGLHLRTVEQRDCRLLWEWANDPTVRASSFSQAPIPWENHQAWFADKVKDPDSLILIGEDEQSRAIGQFRLDKRSAEAGEVDVSVAPDARGAGYGGRLIELAVREVFTRTAIERMHAYIRPENRASILAFEGAGFCRQDMKDVNGCRAVEYVRVRDARQT